MLATLHTLNIFQTIVKPNLGSTLNYYKISLFIRRPILLLNQKYFGTKTVRPMTLIRP